MNLSCATTSNEIELLIPKKEFENTISRPLVSIVIPALNECITIAEFIDWCWIGLSKVDIIGEIIIVDSSDDGTADIALTKGARVLKTPKKGLGQAYLDAIPYIRGEFIIMGDCDLTYDFRNINLFINSFNIGNEFVMGSRFSGSIENGSMPLLHRYFGTPLTTWILNKIYSSSFTDIHCGMRGITKDALIKIDITSKGWEYASEMVLKAKRLGLKIDEVPVKFYKDRDGRLSHHKRSGFWSPWHAGWINLKVMLVYSPESFLIKPGIFSFVLGLLVFCISLGGKFSIGHIGFNKHMMLFGLTAIVLGYSLFHIGIIARINHGLRTGIESYLIKHLTYDAGMSIVASTGFLGLCLVIYFIYNFVINKFVLTDFSNFAVCGILLFLLSVQTFSFVLNLELIRRLQGRKNEYYK